MNRIMRFFVIAPIFIIGIASQAVAVAQMPPTIPPPTSPYTYDGAMQARGWAVDAIANANAVRSLALLGRNQAIANNTPTWAVMGNSVYYSLILSAEIRMRGGMLSVLCDMAWGEAEIRRLNAEIGLTSANIDLADGDFELASTAYYAAYTKYMMAVMAANSARHVYMESYRLYMTVDDAITELHILSGM